MNLQQQLEWRYATKRMTGEKVSPEKIQHILSAIRFSPSAKGFQPFKVLVIEDPQLRSTIRPVANNQAQVEECSHLLVFTAWTSISKDHIDEYIRFVHRERNMPQDALLHLGGMLEKELLVMTGEQFTAWASKQIYLALGIGLIAAVENEVDATPMEGFDPAALDELLGLEEQGLKSVVLMALGYRDITNDWNLKLKKIRRPADELF